MIITKKDVKILRYINRRGSVPKDKLSKKFSSDRVLLLLDGKYLSCDKKFSSKSGYALQTIPLLDHPVDAAGVLSEYDKALREVEEATAE